MPKRPVTSPRKAASQDRSRATVDALLSATARVLVRDGYDRASTNRIAEAAGVSVGSLYQYYPSKEALVAAVIDRHIGDMMALVRQASITLAPLPLPDATRAIVRVMIEAHALEPKLHRVLVEQIPRVGSLERIERLDEEACGLVRLWLEAHHDEIAVTDLDVAAFVVVTTVEALTHAAVLRRPAVLEKVDAFVDEVAKLVVGYLQGRGPCYAAS